MKKIKVDMTSLLVQLQITDFHRGSFQGNAVIEAKASDGTTKEFSVSHWSKDGKKFYQSSTDATGVSYAKGTITDTDGTQHKLTSYEVKCTKYVPV